MTNAPAPATGFVSTAADLARFFGRLDPDAKSSILSPASRREMVRKQWRDPHSAVESHYGEPVRDASGRVREVWLGGTRLITEARAKAEMKRRYDKR